MATSSTRPDIGLTPDERAEFLRANRKAALATIDKDGFPHLVAMTFYEKDGAYWMTSYGKAQKVVNIRRNPKVALMIEAGDAYGELRGVMVRGTCEVIEGPESVEAVFDEMAHRRDPSEPRPKRPAAVTTKRVVLKIVPHKTFTWDHRKLGGRY